MFAAYEIATSGFALLAMTVVVGLLFESPEVYCHVLCWHPFCVPIEEEEVATVSVALSCDSAFVGIGDVLSVRIWQMGRAPDIAFIVAIVSRLADNISPLAVLVASEIDRLCAAGAVGKPRRILDFGTYVIGAVLEVPTVYDEADGLILIGIAGASIYIHGSIVAGGCLLGEVGHEKLVPCLSVSAAMAARDKLFPLLGVHVGGKADLAEVVSADYFPGLLASPSQSGDEDGHEQRDDRDDYEKLYQSKCLSSIHHQRSSCKRFGTSKSL